MPDLPIVTDYVCMTESQWSMVTEKIERIKSWLEYSKAINAGLAEENERLRKQLLSDQKVQVIRIEKERRIFQIMQRKAW